MAIKSTHCPVLADERGIELLKQDASQIRTATPVHGEDDDEQDESRTDH
jgi:hypothetical protein